MDVTRVPNGPVFKSKVRNRLERRKAAAHDSKQFSWGLRFYKTHLKVLLPASVIKRRAVDTHGALVGPMAADRYSTGWCSRT